LKNIALRHFYTVLHHATRDVPGHEVVFVASCLKRYISRILLHFPMFAWHLRRPESKSRSWC